LRGTIKLLPFWGFYPILPTGKILASDVIKIQTSNINYIRVYNVEGNSFNRRNNFTDFININHAGILWRLIAKKNDISIYDDELWGSNTLGAKMILIAYKEITKIYSKAAPDPYVKPIYPLLLKFINNRYKTSFTKKDFKTNDDLLDYILDKESEKRGINK